MSPEEYIARMKMKENAPEAESIVNIASPEAVTEESFMARAPDYTTSFMQQPKPEPSALQQAGAWAGESALGKMGNAGWDKGTQMFTDKVVNPMKTWWGTLANPSAAAGAGQSLTSGAGAAAAGNMAGATGAATPGVMAKLGAATGGAGSGMMAGLGALGPIGLGLGGLMLAKRFGLFNQGGSVGPLSPQYKEGGGEAEDPWGITRRPVQTSSTGPTGGPSSSTPAPYSGSLRPVNPSLYTGEPWEESPGSLRHWNNSDNSSAMDYYKAIPFMGPLGQQKTNPASTKIEKKETIEYKN